MHTSIDTKEESNTDIDLSSDAKDDHNVRVTENRLAAQLFAILEHYKQEDPLGFPGAPIPDPMEVPDIRKSLGMGTLSMIKVKAYGLSKFRIDSVQADLKEMKVNIRVHIFKFSNMKSFYELYKFINSK